jgi:NAD(P)-dependent dehydrogenase (short-subunit alcohol dehydrogenase family)
MRSDQRESLFDLTGKVAVVTGGAGVLCAHVCRELARREVKVTILDIDTSAADRLAGEIRGSGGQAQAIEADVCKKDSLRKAAQQIIDIFGKVDILINGAGGNHPQATTSADRPFFDLPDDALNWVIDLNLISTIYASQVFGKLMAERKTGVILNISSMNAYRPLTRIPAYSAAKAAVNNFTQWLAVHMAQEYSPEIRVNAIAPGFFLTQQNRYLLTDEATGDLTPRGRAIIEHTPLARFGVPQDLVGIVLCLLSPGAGFISGVTVPIDGGFSAFSGV